MRQTAIHVTILLVLVAIAALTLRGLGNQSDAERKRQEKLSRVCEIVERRWELATAWLADPNRAPVAQTARVTLEPIKAACDR